MIFLVICWGFDYVPAKLGLEILTPMCLLFYKYILGVPVAIIIKLITKSKYILRVKDIPMLIACVICGDILYFFCEYRAMDYIPVSLLTIILAFVPMVSIIIERIVFKIKANRVMIIGIAICIVGVILVIGSDLSILFSGRAIGYVLAFGAVLAWNGYNFITMHIDGYDSTSLSINQMMCTLLIIWPVVIPNMPPIESYTPAIVAGLLFIGIIDSGLGFVIVVNSLQKLGPTTSAVYSDFMPVTATIFGAIFLGESITLVQLIGGLIVISAGFIVIKEKGKLDEARLKTEQESDKITDGLQ
ncbi:MAG: DMT family transporter [Firmicutes bacterium]|nr:DMT family transporter [Bacillota bacterium]